MNTIDSILLDNHNIDKPDSFIKKLMGSIVNSTRLSNQMPIGSEYDYVETLSTEGKEFKTNINDTKEDILYLLNRINKFVHSSSDTNSGSSGEAIFSYENVQALIETLLERADLRFDEIQGIDRSNIAIKAKGTTGQDSGSFQTQTQPQSHLLPKPQYSFYKNIIINNNKNEPFQPKLKTKPHAKRPLNMQPCYYSDSDSDANANTNTNTNSSTCMDTNNKTSIIKKKILTPANYFYQHPYQYELDNIKYPEWQLQDCSDLSNASSTSINIITNLTNNIKNHPYEYVDNKESLYSAISEMSLYNELAVDLEHHSIHTYLGMTCLIQISTRDKDYILDVIALKTDPTFATGNGTGTSTTNSSISNISSSPNPNPNPNPNSYALQELNKVFCDPNIVKIFHGCNHDILWLQRDCGIYVVNCFDTYQACIELEYKSQSLSSLLKKYVHYDASKQYQLSDWRIRPLKNELISYARDDTHYLLFIYDCLRREIFNNSNNATIHGRVGLDSYMAVLNRSRDVCLSRYEKPAFDPLGYTHTLLSRRRGTSDLSATQKQYMAALWMWRDIKARDIDESSTYILTNTDITKLTNKCPMNVDDIKKALMGPSKKPLATFLSCNEKDGILFEILEAVHESFGVASSSSSSSKVKSKKSLSDEQINTTKNVVTPSTVAAVASSTAVTFHSLFSFRPCVSQVEKEQVSGKTNGIFVDMMHTDLNLSSFSKDSTSASASTINSASKQFESNWSVACSLSEDENEDDNEDKAQMVLDKCASFMQPYMQPQAFMRNQAVKLNEVKKEESIQTSTSTSTIGGKNRTLTAKENADIEALGTIAVELVEDEIMNKKRKIAEMENEVVTTGPEEAEEGSQYVNLKSNKSSKLSMSYKKHKSSGSGIGNGSSNPGYMRPTASHEAKNVVDYNAISMTTLQEVSAAGNNYGAQYGGSWDKAEKEKEKKREQKLAKKALKAGFGNGNGNGSKSEDAKTRATTDKSKGKVKGKGFNPYFAQLTGTEKVPSRDHDRAYTFK